MNRREDTRQLRRGLHAPVPVWSAGSTASTYAAALTDAANFSACCSSTAAYAQDVVLPWNGCLDEISPAGHRGHLPRRRMKRSVRAAGGVSAERSRIEYSENLGSTTANCNRRFRCTRRAAPLAAGSNFEGALVFSAAAGLHHWHEFSRGAAFSGTSRTGTGELPQRRIATELASIVLPCCRTRQARCWAERPRRVAHGLGPIAAMPTGTGLRASSSGRQRAHGTRTTARSRRNRRARASAGSVCRKGRPWMPGA